DGDAGPRDCADDRRAARRPLCRDRRRAPRWPAHDLVELRFVEQGSHRNGEGRLDGATNGHDRRRARMDTAAVATCRAYLRPSDGLLVIAISCVALSPAFAAQTTTELKNWYDDPYFAVSSAVAGCPVPRGPYATKVEMEREAHVRVERGLRCYQWGK